MLDLHSPTYFYRETVLYVEFSALTLIGNRCSPGLFTELRLLLELAGRTLVRPQDTTAEQSSLAKGSGRSA
jgi:hypothetical protein